MGRKKVIEKRIWVLLDARSLQALEKLKKPKGTYCSIIRNLILEKESLLCAPTH